MTGERATSLLGSTVGQVVAFRFDGGWHQIPVQIDQRVDVDFAAVYGLAPIGLTTSAYADPETFTGPDVDPLFDGDDELVVLGRDTGIQRAMPMTFPTGTVADVGVELMVVDPLDEEVRYAYLLRSDGSLDPAAGRDDVTYDFQLLAGNYLANYDTDQGPNPEDSEAVSSFYRTHFSDRWIRDELQVWSGNSTGVDILDRHTNRFGPGICYRSEDTFTAGEGAFVANRDGPIRGIRSYVGANSGPLTQRDHFFYDRRQDIVTTLRVHDIPGVMDLYDYSPDAVGMIYANDLNQAGVIVDGVNDILTAGPISWELMSGPQGTLTILHSVQTDLPNPAHTSYYLDDVASPINQCTGDTLAIGTSGVWIDHAIPNTDPLLGSHYNLQTRRTVYYGDPDQGAAQAESLAEQDRHPLIVHVRPYPPPKGDVDQNCRIELSDFAYLEACLSSPTSCSDPACGPFDWDEECSVSLDDYAHFQEVFTGSNQVLRGCEP